MTFLKKLNKYLFFLPLMLTSLGFITHLSTSSERALDHLLYYLLGLFAFVIFSKVDVRIYPYFAKYLHIGTILLLLIVDLFGMTVLGSSRWIHIGSFNFQPSELAKIDLVIFTACYFGSKGKIEFKTLMKYLASIVPVLALVFLQPDLGSTLVLSGSVMLMLFLGGLNIWYFVLGFSAFGIASSPLWNLLQDYQKNRILVFLNPNLDTLGKGYNVVQSLIAVGSGGLWGKGFGNGSQSHLNFLPIYWTDFIFASYAEEWGFIGVTILLALFCVFILTLIYILNQNEELYLRILIAGAIGMFIIPIIINIGMNIGLLPVTGIPLPFMSLGGTAMITHFILLGIVQNIWLIHKDL